MRFWFGCLIRLVLPLLHFKSKTWFYNEQWNHRRDGVATGIIQISKKVIPDAHRPGVEREGACPESDSADVLTTVLVPNIPFLNDWSTLNFWLYLKGTLNMGWQEWCTVVRISSSVQPELRHLSQPKTCRAGSRSCHPHPPCVASISGFHSGADRDCPQRPGHRSLPGESSGQPLCKAGVLLRSPACHWRDSNGRACPETQGAAPHFYQQCSLQELSALWKQRKLDLMAMIITEGVFSQEGSHSPSKPVQSRILARKWI